MKFHFREMARENANKAEELLKSISNQSAQNQLIEMIFQI